MARCEAGALPEASASRQRHRIPTGTCLRLNVTEFDLKTHADGDRRAFQRMQGHTVVVRVTATFRRKDGRTLHVRKATRAEPEQQKIFRALGTDPAPGGIRKMIV